MKKNSALLLIDLQNDFFEGGSLAIKNSNQIIPIVNNLIQFFKTKDKLIIATLDWHPLNHRSFASVSKKKVGTLGMLNDIPQVWWPNHCVQNSFGAEIHKLILKNHIDYFVYKGTDANIDSYSAFFDNNKIHKTNLDAYLKNKKINNLYILGLATDYCVKYSVLDALSLGYKVNFINDASKAVNLSMDDEEEAILTMSQKGAVILNSKDILNQ